MSAATGILGVFPIRSHPWSVMPVLAPPIRTLDDLLREFAALADESEPVRSVRGMVLAVAECWLVGIPAGPRRDRAMERLADAAELAVDALDLAS